MRLACNAIHAVINDCESIMSINVKIVAYNRVSCDNDILGSTFMLPQSKEEN